MREGRATTAGLFGAGLLFCVIVVMLPDLLPALVARPGAVWSPVRSMNYHLGDLYYYAAYVREALSLHWPITSPSAHELRGVPLVETWRFTGLLLGALPGLFIADFRYVLLAGYGLSAALFFAFPFVVAWRLTGRAAVAAAVGLAVLFATDRIWTPLPTHPESLSAIGSWLAGLPTLAWALGRATLSLPEYDLYGSAFRYVNISLSAPILLGYFAAMALLYTGRGRLWAPVVALATPLMGFTYPSHVLIAFGLLGGFAAVSLWRRDLAGTLVFGVIALAGGLFLLLIHYPGMVRDVAETSELWKNIFARESFTLRSDAPSFFLAVALNKYVLSFLLMLLLARGNPVLREVIVAVALVALPLSLVHLLATPQLWARFLGRGIDHIWVLLMATTIGDALARAAARTASSAARRVAAATLALLLVLPLAGVPAWAFGRLALIHLDDESRYLPAPVMDAYRWIDGHVPKEAQVATLDWEDISILPAYTDADLVLGNSVIDGRSPMEELRRFVETWKAFGRPREDLLRLAEAGPAGFDALSNVSTVPFADPASFDASQFILGVLYWPYVLTVGDVEIVTPGTKTITPEFRALLLRLFDEADPATFAHRLAVDYALRAPGDPKVPGCDRELFRNAARILYACGEAE